MKNQTIWAGRSLELTFREPLLAMWEAEGNAGGFAFPRNENRDIVIPGIIFRRFLQDAGKYYDKEKESWPDKPFGSDAFRFPLKSGVRFPAGKGPEIVHRMLYKDSDEGPQPVIEHFEMIPAGSVLRVIVLVSAEWADDYILKCFDAGTTGWPCFGPYWSHARFSITQSNYYEAGSVPVDFADYEKTTTGGMKK